MASINRDLLPLKVILFCWFGASACLLPYMTIHMKQLGITVKETAIVYAILPVSQVMGPPIAGFVADKMGRYKPVLLISLISCMISATAIMFVPGSGDPDTQYRHPPSEREQLADHYFTFWIYFALRIMFAICNAICCSLLDATTILLSDLHKSSFGRERVWAIFATGIFSPVCGWLIDSLNVDKDEYSTDYSPSFYFFNGLVFLNVITLLVLNIEVAPPPPNLWKNFMPILKSRQIWLFLMVIFVLGTCWGFVESFLFWYLLELNAPKYLLGLTLTTGALVGLPFLHQSDWFVRKLGHVNLLIIALIFYLIRFGGYSLISSPWWSIPFEAMEAFTYHLMWVAAATYSAKLAPPGLMATIQGLVGGLHYGIARGAGCMLGGTLMATFSARIAFRVIGIIAGITALIYSALYYGIIRKYYNNNMSQQKHPSNETQENDERGVMLIKCTKIDINANSDIQSLDNHLSSIEMRQKSNPEEKQFLNSSINETQCDS